MPTIALIGPDGAGKTTLTRMLAGSGLLPFRYLYMGIDVSASNLALPTSRLIERLKPWVRQGRRIAAPGEGAQSRSADRRRRQDGRLWSAARLANRLAEEWFRQLASWFYQLRGCVVLYDRHFAFDFAPELMGEAGMTLTGRLHGWCLKYLYPRPDLVIFLDAPGEVLYARKGESTIAELERRRQAFLHIGAKMPGFVRVDATRPLSKVYQEVAQHVVRFCGGEQQTSTALEEQAIAERGRPATRWTSQVTINEKGNRHESRS